MTTISEVHNSVNVPEQQIHAERPTSKKDGDSIFSHAARKMGMDCLADFLRDDWSAEMARKAGYDNFADWIENKDENNNEKDGNVFENIARTAVKHPVLTIATVALSIFAGRQIFKTLTNKANVVAQPAEVITQTPVKVIPEKIIAPIDTIPKDIQSVNKIIEEGLEYERGINFSNLEILKDIPDKERRLILSYFRETKKEKDLLLFASGNKPALLEGIPSLNDDIFDALRSNSVSVSEFFTNSGAEGNLIINNKAAQKIIGENIVFFRERLELSPTATAEEIFKKLCQSSGPLQNSKKAADLRSLLLGHYKYDAYYKQLALDLRNFSSYNYDKYKESFTAYKEALKRAVGNEKFTYAKMSPEFKADLVRKIDSFSEKAFKEIIFSPTHVFPDAAYERQQIEALRNLALKLKQAQGSNLSIGF